MHFIKLHVDWVYHTGLTRAARLGAKELELMPWIFLFPLFAEAEDGSLAIGGKPAEPVDIARYIVGRVSAKRVARCLAELEKAGVLERLPSGVLRIVEWQGRVAGRFSETKEEVARRKRESRRRNRNEINSDGHDGHAGVTTQSQSAETRAQSDSEEVRARAQSWPQRPALAADADAIAANANGNLPHVAWRFLAHVPEKRRSIVEGQMRAVLGDGLDRSGQRLRVSYERLARDLGEVWALIESGKSIRDPWAYALEKLADPERDAATSGTDPEYWRRVGAELDARDARRAHENGMGGTAR